MTPAPEINPAVTVPLAATRKPADLIVITERIRKARHEEAH
jgi:hypothetical protein